MPSTFRCRFERAAISPAPATPASAAPPASSGVFAFCAALATPEAALWAPLLTVSTAARAGFCFAVLARVRLELPARERDDVALPRDAEFDLPRDDVGLPRDVEFDRPRDVDFDFPRDVDELARVRFVRVPVARPSDPLREAPLVPPLLPDRDLADLD